MSLAQQLAPDLTENQILASAFEIMAKEQGIKTARYYFYYNEDFPSDLISEYFNLNNLESA